jgi:type IX secretion system PorP/SprF family membrane protein
MKNILRSLSCTLVLVAGYFTANAQDPHFSQYYTFASFLNPALVGNYDGSYRLAALYRSQWTSSLGSGNGYNTVGADADVALLEGYLKHSRLALGVGFMDDRSGQAGLNYLNADLTLAYHQGFGKDGAHRLSIGLQGGYIQKTIENPTYSDQHIIDNFGNPLLVSAEQPYKGVHNGDLNAGLYWKSNFHDVVRLGFGLGVYHILQPQENVVNSPTSTTFSNLYRKYSADINLEGFFGKGKHMSLSPELLFLQEGPAREITPGLFWSYYFQTGFRKNNSLDLGVRYRYSSGPGIGDAVIPMVMAEFRNLRLGFSYDVNVSSLNATTSYRGAFEVGLTYVGESIKSFKGSRSLPSRRF